jgi:hypothetical protein
MRVFRTISDCSSHVKYKQIIVEKQKHSPLTVNCNNIQLNPSYTVTCASNLCPRQGAGDIHSCARFIKIEPSSRLRDGGEGGTVLFLYRLGPLHLSDPVACFQPSLSFKYNFLCLKNILWDQLSFLFNTVQFYPTVWYK